MQEISDSLQIKEEELNKMTDKYRNEVLMKQVAVNKLAEVMNRKDTDLQSNFLLILFI